eukprot:COSAG01_NODE_33665_length_560_cov_7.308026_2_plen_101_part_00
MKNYKTIYIKKKIWQCRKSAHSTFLDQEEDRRVQVLNSCGIVVHWVHEQFWGLTLIVAVDVRVDSDEGCMRESALLFDPTSVQSHSSLSSRSAPGSMHGA